MSKSLEARIESRYQLAKEQFAELGVATERALTILGRIPISLHCWQGDDVGGFESAGGLSGGGIMATGNYPGKARTPDELRQDLQTAYSLIPGKQRLNLHAIYGEFGGKKVDRDQIAPEHFATWIAWAKERHLGLDFNPSFFSHPKAASGFTLANYDDDVREFWIEHARACRRIGAHMGRELGSPCLVNVWIPDGFKDTPIDRRAPRELLKGSLDQIFAERYPRTELKDAVECKLFGIGSESCVIGSHEFYMGYALANSGLLLTLDSGHFHPTEVISDKISSILTFIPEIMLHVSRGVRWDSDHVVVLSDELQAIAQEIIRNDYIDRVHLGLDYFDASINRIAAWTIGARSTIKALLGALLEPTARLRELELNGNYGRRLALLEELKTMPVGAVWDYYCLKQGVPVGTAWMDAARDYDVKVLSQRG